MTDYRSDHITRALKAGIRPSKNIEDARGLAPREIGDARSWLDTWSDFAGATTQEDMNKRMQEDLDALNPKTEMKGVHMPAADKMIAAMGRAKMSGPTPTATPSYAANLMSAPTAKPAAVGAKKAAAVDKKVIDTIMKEAVYGDIEDMSMVASVMQNRSTLTGTSLKDVALAPGEFSATARKSWPPGVNTPKNRQMAEQAVSDVLAKGPTTKATYYATPSRVGHLPSGLSKLGKTKGHVTYTDPQNRPIGTRRGYIAPTVDRLAKFAEKVAGTVQTSAVDAVQAVREAVGLSNNVQRGKPSKNTDVNLGPVSDLGVAAPRAKVDYSIAGKGRPNKPTGDIVDRIAKSVAEALGTGYSINVSSGMENPLGIQVGSDRHKTGKAADFSIIGPDGRTLSLANKADRAKMEKVAEVANKNGITGTGMGTDYMGGNHMHFDTAPIGPGQDNEWGNIGNGSMKSRLASARKGLLSETTTTPTARPTSPSEIASLQATQDKREYERSAPKASPKAKAALDAIAAGADLAPDRKMDTVSGRPISRVGAPAIDTAAPAGTPGPMGTTMNATTRAAIDKLGELVGGMVGKQAQPSARKSEQDSMAALESMMPGFADQPSPLAKTAPPVAQVAQPSIASSFPARPEVVAPNDPNKTILSAPALAAPREVRARKVADVALAQPEEVQPIAPAQQPVAPMRAKVGAAPAGTPAQGVAAAPRSFSVADVDNGLTDIAYDNTGQNIVGRDNLGRRSVTNKFGVTTVTNAAGNQVATVDNGPLSKKSLSQDPNESILGGIGKSIKGKVDSIDRKSVVGTVIGGALGSLLGPAGTAIGAKVGSSLAKGRLGELFSKNTFPDAPTAPANANKGNGGRSISAASRAEIDRSAGGLF